MASQRVGHDLTTNTSLLSSPPPGWMLSFIHATIRSKHLSYYFYLLIFGPRCVACGILVPQPGIEPMPHAVDVQSLNQWKTREVLIP